MPKLTKNQKVAAGAGILGLIAALVAATKAKAAPPVICTPGEEKCIGPNWCRCNPAGTKWIVLIKNSPVCIPVTTAVLYGTVKDAVTREVIEGILVDCNGYTGTTGSDGMYRIEDIPPGEYSVSFSDPLGRYEEKVI